MIYVRLAGGLGNQLFQYAMARRLAGRHHTDVLIDATGYGDNGEARPKDFVAFPRPLSLFQFKVKARTATADELVQVRDDFYRATTRDRVVRRLRRVWPQLLWNERHIIERQYRFHPDTLEFPDNVYLQGFWQSPKYFSDISQEIRAELQLADANIEQSAREAVNRLKEKYRTVVSLHVRRGDLAHAHETLGRNDVTHGAPVSLNYIYNAINRFDNETCFFIFSDSLKDIEWCRANIRAKHTHFSSAESELCDFTAMSMCDHHIIANSTFSWWSAWLDPKPEKRVIAPSQWSDPSAAVRMATDDLIPAEWELI